MKKFNLYHNGFLKTHNIFVNEDFPVTYLVAMADSEYKRGVSSNANIKGNMLSYFSGSYFEPYVCIDLSFYQSQIDEYKEYLMGKILGGSLTPYEKSLNNVLYRETISLTNLPKEIGIISSFPNAYYKMKQQLEFEDYIDAIRHKSEYYGVVKKRYNIKLKILLKKYIQKYDTYVINAVDDDDNLFFWFEKNEVTFNVKDYVKVRATIKKHSFSEFIKAKETRLNRVVYC